MQISKKKGTILIVDNESANIQLLAATLGPEYELLTANSGEEALAVVSRAPQIDLILLDIVMPGLDGYETCRRLKSQPQYEPIPIVFITSMRADANEIRGLEAGGADYITKPFCLNKVRARIKIQFDLKRSHDLLVNSMRENQLILDSAEEGIFAIDGQGRAVFVNASAAKMTGYSREVLLGTDPRRLCLQADGVILPRPLVEAPCGPGGHEGELRQQSQELFTRQDGSCFPVEYTVTPTPLSEPVMRAVVVFTDITLRRQREEEELKIQKLLAISLLAGGVAHDFNNLLAVVAGYLDLGGESTENEETRRMIDLAKDYTFRAAALAKKLISFSEGGYPMKSRLDLPGIVRASSEKSIVFPFGNQLLIAPGLWPVCADAGQIRQVVENLYLNAKEAMPNGGRIETTLGNGPATLSSEGVAGPSYVQLTITDHGQGIAPEVMPKIYDPYFSTKSRGSIKGMGFGLSLCLAIVRRHKGTIKVESEPGQGTVVTVCLPVTASAEAESN